MATGPTGENTKPGQLRESSTTYCGSLWFWLLIWACLRLAVAVIWVTLLMVITYQAFASYWVHRAWTAFPKDLGFQIIALVLQLVEFSMVVTFIIAGMKNSKVLYRIYYYYCIIALIFYAISMALCFIPYYNDGHHFGEIYLTFNISVIFALFNEKGIYIIISAIAFNIFLEVFLICLIKKMLNKNSKDEDRATCERV